MSALGADLPDEVKTVVHTMASGGYTWYGPAEVASRGRLPREQVETILASHPNLFVPNGILIGGIRVYSLAARKPGE
ncbi:MAG: hypothetical protein O3A46_06005 [Candidatus Poribacteria bacterium]|nr:hypothetical protein [Candidatus Poribacteria bacterium]